MIEEIAKNKIRYVDADETKKKKDIKNRLLELEGKEISSLSMAEMKVLLVAIAIRNGWVDNELKIKLP